MSASRAALQGLTEALAAASGPVPVLVEQDGAAVTSAGPDGTPSAAPEGAAADDPSVRLAVLGLTRLGRSTRDGPVLDLALLVRVLVAGPSALETTEALLTALERDAHHVVEPLGPQDGGRLGFRVTVRVPVRMEQPVGPPVRHPLQVDVVPARLIAGTVVDAAGTGVAGAVVRARAGGRPVTADPDGRFRALGADAPEQDFVVEVQGATKVVQAATRAAPVIIRWE